VARGVFGWLKTWPPWRTTGGYWTRLFPGAPLAPPPDEPPEAHSDFEHIEGVDHLKGPRSDAMRHEERPEP
jgi:hypothetical protein